MTEYHPPTPASSASFSVPPVPRPTLPSPSPTPSAEGEISRLPSFAPIRVILIATGLILIKNLLMLISRYLLALKGNANISIERKTLTITTEWSLLGRPIRRSVTTAPLEKVAAVRFENRQRYLYLLVGIGCLVVGALLGAQWFLNGLRAGYPYLTLLGAFFVLAGIAVDLVLYIYYPFRRRGRSYLILSIGPWKIRLRGVRAKDAERVIEAVHTAWQL